MLSAVRRQALASAVRYVRTAAAASATSGSSEGLAARMAVAGLQNSNAAALRSEVCANCVACRTWYLLETGYLPSCLLALRAPASLRTLCFRVGPPLGRELTRGRLLCTEQRVGWSGHGLHSSAVRCAAESDVKDPKILKELMDDHSPNDLDDALKAELDHATGLERMELEAAVQVCNWSKRPQVYFPRLFCIWSLARGPYVWMTFHPAIAFHIAYMTGARVCRVRRSSTRLG